ncbi:fimbrial biogenesis chaperone [Halomonas maura]|uniref:fimbrial biogenesis chaperone n=1 Tax=Halomonas maura TaxID=117606 RepID=UPI0025B38366|nr:molecular chaperone [Halomonas maura]MDN3556610.1 molecular chaperone [Halomonas maura]
MNRPWRTWKRWLVGLGISLATLATQAASLSVNPVRVTLHDPQQIRHLQLRNAGDEPMVLQVSVKDLSIADNREQYADSDALVVTPPVFTIEPGGEQVVRLGLENPVSAGTERAFRIFLEQSPGTPGATDDNDQPTQIQVNLRLGIPVFVSPNAPMPRALDWEIKSTDDRHVRVVAENQGNTHSRITTLSLRDEQGEVLAESDRLTYLLPGTRRAWTLTLPADGGRPHHLRFRDQHGSTEMALRSR